MTRSVVATGKVEPITKVEIKSKANGIIERLLVDVDQVVQPGQVLAELDKENLTARLREARANLQAAEAAREAAAGPAEEERDRGRGARRGVRPAATYERAEQLFEQKLVSQSGAGRSQAARSSRPRTASARRSGSCDQPGAGWPRPRPTWRRPRPPSSAPRRSWPTPPSGRRSAPRC